MAKKTIITGTRNSDPNLLGTIGDDNIQALNGNDTITGLAGNDMIDGGGGTNDTAVFSVALNSYAADNYSFQWLSDGSLRVSGTDGVDNLTGVEFLKIGDQTYGINGPVARSDGGSGTENQTITITNVLANDTSLQTSAALAIQKVGGGNAVIGDTVAILDGIDIKLGANNSLIIDPVTTWDYLAEGETLTRTFNYSIGNGTGHFATAPVTLILTGTNDGPVAVIDAKATTEDTPLVFSASDLVSNDSDVDHLDVLTVTSVAATTDTHGTVTLLNGQITYTPEANYNGVASFSYNVSDSRGGTATATVNLTVNAVNDAPEGTDSGIALPEDYPFFWGPGLVIGNETLARDADGDTLIAELISGPSHAGHFEWFPEGNAETRTFLYRPEADFSGTDTITYRLFDGQAYSDLITYTIVITPSNDAPTLTTSTPIAVTEDAAVTTSVATLTKGDAKDGDPSGNAVTYDIAGWTQVDVTHFAKLGTYGTATLDSAANTLTYTINNADSDTNALITGQTEHDIFTITVKDTDGAVASQDVDFTVNGADEPTLFIYDATGTEGDGTITFTVSLSAPFYQDVVWHYFLGNQSGTIFEDVSAGPEPGGSGIVTFAPGETTKTLTFNVFDDAIFEGTETFGLMSNSEWITTADGTRIYISNLATGIGTIIDNDAQPTISIDNVTVTEGVDSNAVFTVSLSNPSASPVSVQYFTSAGNASIPGFAGGGSDFTQIGGGLIFAPGETTKTISIPVSDDQTHESTEIFYVNLYNASGGAILGTGQAVGTILDNDAPVVPSFANAVSYPTGFAPSWVALSDVNGDGALDAITANHFGSSISVMAGASDGSFSAPTTYFAGSGSISLALGDVNEDGQADIVTADPFGSSISVLTANGDGTFTNSGSFVAGAGPRGIALADFNEDGHLDAVTANASAGATDAVSVLLGTGDGNFSSPLNNDGTANSWPVVVGDLDGDGHQDVVVARSAASVLLGNGDGTFNPAVNYNLGTAGPNSVSIALGDANGDGHLDLISALLDSNKVSVMLGNGDGSLQAGILYDVGQGPYSVTVGDVNGDGKVDIATANAADDTVSLLLGLGTGEFQAQHTYAVGDGPNSVTMGDVNGDGRTDLLTANFDSNTMSVLLQNWDFVV